MLLYFPGLPDLFTSGDHPEREVDPKTDYYPRTDCNTHSDNDTNRGVKSQSDAKTND